MIGHPELALCVKDALFFRETRTFSLSRPVSFWSIYLNKLSVRFAFSSFLFR
jgi:hypothetical protein